jgi:thymidylate synthase ThyX
MPLPRQIYLLDPKKLSPETIAVTFAKTSRSPESFHEIAAELTDEKSAEFHEKWVVGYGHSSVAEHAVLHLAVENISRLAVECLESNRLASYTEKSTRYQKWNPEDFFTPPEFLSTLIEDLYTDTCRKLFDTYQRTLPAVKAVLESENPRRPDESESAWDRRIRTQYIDVCRYLLPAASLANVGVTINARALEHAICKMLSHPLREVQQMGAEIKSVAQAEVPTLVKYADAEPCLMAAAQLLADQARKVAPLQDEVGDWCRLVDFDADGEKQVLAAALFRFGQFSYNDAFSHVNGLTQAEQGDLAKSLLDGLDEHTTPLRELEHMAFTFELVIDQGAFFELKRHRMMTLTSQPLTTRLGYAVPRRMVLAGMEGAYREAMDATRAAYEKLYAFNPEAASYVVPNGFKRRVLFTINLRSLEHLVALRSGAGAHFSLRRVAQRLAEEVRRVMPVMGSYLRVEPGETYQQIEQEHFSEA